ncbi:MAG: STAS domain-containing protein [Clostridiales bacterium]|nr:STAS domain-containing protein [Clostridiales bacterium]
MLTTVYEKAGTKLTVWPEGRMDTVSSPILERELRQHLEGIKDIVMDFSNVAYVSSGGIRVLLALDKLISERGGSLKLIHVKEHILEIFELVGFMQLVEVVQD